MNDTLQNSSFLVRRRVTSVGPAHEQKVGVTLENPCRKHRLRRRGAAVVEFAVVAPIFVALVLGMIEFGRALMVQQLITNASREGARVAVLEGATSAEVTTAVEERLATIDTGWRRPRKFG